MKLAFLGTPDAAASALDALAADGHDIRLVVTRADKRRGREGASSPSPVKEAATRLALPVSHRVDDVIDAGAELGVVVAFGQLIKPHVLAALPMINLHFSLLPRWRGAAPVERAILAGDTETGVCVMEVEEGLDTGGVYARVTVPIDDTDTAASLRAKLVSAGTDLLVDALRKGLASPEPQSGEPTYAAKVTAEDLRLDFTHPAAEIQRVVRVGRAWTTFRGKRLLVLDAGVAPGALPAGVLDGLDVGTAGGLLHLHTVQPEGKPPLDADAWRNGARPRPGERLGDA